MPTADLKFTGVDTTQKFNLIGAGTPQLFRGYYNKEDKTVLPPGCLIEGSQNVVITNKGTMSARKGFIRLGQDDTTLAGVYSAFDWERRNGDFRHMRSANGKLQYYYKDPTTGVITWNDLITGLGDKVLFRYADWWDGVDSALKTTELKAFLLMCNGTDRLYQWSGGTTTVSSVAATTITKAGTTTWSEDGFYNTNKDKGGATTEFTITNPTGTTFRYTWTTVGTDPVITAITFPIGVKLYIKGQNFNAGNNGVFTITGSGANYFEVTNAAGVAEATKTIGTGFLTMYPSQLNIGNAVFTYHGGGDTTTITDVIPSAAALVAGTLITQTCKEFPVSAMGVNSGFTAIPKKIDNIAVLNQQLYVIDESYRFVYVSKLNDFLNYSFTTPVRLVGEGALITLDGNPKVLIPQEQEMYISASTNQWYKTKFTLSADNSSESLSIDRLKTSYQKAAQTQEWVTKTVNDVVVCTYEPTMDSLGRVANILGTPQGTNMSDAIKNDFDSYNFEDGSIFYFKNYIYLAFPKENIVRIWNIARDFWEAPQILPISRFSIIDDELIGHSYNNPLSYKLFSGIKDNADPDDSVAGTGIDSRAVFSYQNYAARELTKYFNELYVEGYIQQNTNLTIGVNFEINGIGGNWEKVIKGTDTTVINVIPDNASFGKNLFGKNPIGGVIDKDANIFTSEDLPNKLRAILQIVRTDFYECSFYFRTSGIDEKFELICLGALATKTAYGSNKIKI